MSKHTDSMGVIAKNTENYISFSIKVKVGMRLDKNGMEVPVEIDLRFINSFRFMSSSLDSLVKNLASGGHKFKGFNGYNAKQRSFLVMKEVYPYEYMDSWDRFEDTSLPSTSRFHSKLNMSGIRNEDYAHALEI